MEMELLLGSFVALLALINPIQKIFLITSLQDHFSDKELRYLSSKSSLTAFIILIFFLFLGHVIFNYIFHIQFMLFRPPAESFSFTMGSTDCRKVPFCR